MYEVARATHSAQEHGELGTTMPCALCAANLRQTKEALKLHFSVPSKLQSSFTALVGRY